MKVYMSILFLCLFIAKESSGLKCYKCDDCGDPFSPTDRESVVCEDEDNPTTDPTTTTSTTTTGNPTTTTVTEPTTTVTEPTTTVTEPTTTVTDPTTTVTDPTTVPTDPTTAQTDPTTAQTDPTTAQTDPTTVPTDPTTASTDPTTNQTPEASTPAEITDPTTAIDRSNTDEQFTDSTTMQLLEKIPSPTQNPKLTKGQMRFFNKVIRQEESTYRCYKLEVNGSIKRGCVKQLTSDSETCASIEGASEDSKCSFCVGDECNSANGLSISLVTLVLCFLYSLLR